MKRVSPKDSRFSDNSINLHYRWHPALVPLLGACILKLGKKQNEDKKKQKKTTYKKITTTQKYKSKRKMNTIS